MSDGENCPIDKEIAANMRRSQGILRRWLVAFAVTRPCPGGNPGPVRGSAKTITITIGINRTWPNSGVVEHEKSLLSGCMECVAIRNCTIRIAGFHSVRTPAMFRGSRDRQKISCLAVTAVNDSYFLNTYDFLIDNNCDFVQGYFYSHPLPQEEFLEFVEKQDFHTQRRKALEIV